ncbi:S8 family serine peptidase [bacterium]|nr:S8 family serine peptidase [bacterium]
MFLRVILAVGLVATSLIALASADDRRPPPDTAASLQQLSTRLEARSEVLRGPTFRQYRSRTTGPMGRLNADPRLSLEAVLPSGRPMYLELHNRISAETVRTDQVWPGGPTGLNLLGLNAPGELALWDGGVVRVSHQEFSGRATVLDGGTSLSDHATHVAGTMVAAGVDVQATGMSRGAYIGSYDWSDDEIEMAGAAGAGLRLSNHSYGWVTGWRYGLGGDQNWYWFGDPEVSELEDPGFGFYASGTASWDAIAHAAPYYLIVKSAGNDRDDTGPGPGGGHYVWDGDLGDFVWSTVTRNPDGAPDGHDTIGYRGNAKNILTVGAVEDIPGGWTDPADVVASPFTGWGPSDDGRIKPDLVANGVTLYSSLASGDNAYGTYSGTSMAAPSASGSLNLVLAHHQALTGTPLLASTVKAIALHTTDEAGPAPGPDYMFGWGLLNTERAVLLVDDHAAGGARIVEDTLDPGEVARYRFWHDGAGDLRFTLAWTDPEGTPPPWSLDPAGPMLVHDLDLRVIREGDGTVSWPWRLDPASPATPAVTGENDRDNVETVEVTGAAEGSYLVEIDHDGTLTGPQIFSLVQTGGRPLSVTAVESDLPRGPVRRLEAAPNPFNPRTVIRLSLDRTERTRVAVYDARGRRVATLHDGPLAGGEHRLTWDGRDGRGRQVAAGVYLVQVRAASQQASLRISLVK